jgi:hypothetical protein
MQVGPTWDSISCQLGKSVSLQTELPTELPTEPLRQAALVGFWMLLYFKKDKSEPEIFFFCLQWSVI